METNKSNKNETNWDLCFICQETKTKAVEKSLRTTEEGLCSLADMLIKFNETDALRFDIDRLC